MCLRHESFGMLDIEQRQHTFQRLDLSSGMWICHIGAQKDDAAYPPSKHARLHKDQITPKSARVAARGGPAGRGGARATGRGKAKMLADESRFSRPHPLQVTCSTDCLPPSCHVSTLCC